MPRLPWARLLSLALSLLPKATFSLGESKEAPKPAQQETTIPATWVLAMPHHLPAQPYILERWGRTLLGWIIPRPCGVAGMLSVRHGTGMRAPLVQVPFMPLEKPRQLAKINSGRCSRLKSRMAWAVLKAESGNQTCPACWIICRRWQEAVLRLVRPVLPGTPPWQGGGHVVCKSWKKN